MKSAPAEQLLLLDVAEADLRVRRAEVAARTAPQADRVRELQAERQSQSRELAERAARRDALRAEIARIESDVQVVTARAKRDEERLARSANAKDAQGLQSELTSLARRLSSLEDAQLEAMDALERAEQSVAETERAVAATNDEGARLSAAAKAHIAEAQAAGEQAKRDRAAVAASVPAPLLAAYERITVRGGVGAARLLHGTCDACRMLISGTDLKTLRELGPDDVATCPECGAILVRGADSGL